MDAIKLTLEMLIAIGVVVALTAGALLAGVVVYYFIKIFRMTLGRIDKSTERRSKW